MKKYPSPDESDYPWVASSRGTSSQEDCELVSNRDKIKVIGGYDDDDGFDYGYSYGALIRLKDKYYFLTTAGCSCPSPSETWIIDFGPSTKKEMKEWLSKGNAKQKEIIKLL